MRRMVSIFLFLTLLAGCREAGVQDFWRTHSIDYSDVNAAQDQFAIFAEKAVAAPEADALAAIDVLFDRLKEDEVAYYLYTDWIDDAFYHLLSPCRNAAVFAKAVERMAVDGILSEGECAPYLQKAGWIQFNQEGTPATLPVVVPQGMRTLVLVLDLGCPSCREALTVLAGKPEWADCRHVAIGCGPGARPDVPGWEYYFPDNATDIFDPHLTPVYFVVSPDGKVEIPYALAL